MIQIQNFGVAGRPERGRTALAEGDAEDWVTVNASGALQSPTCQEFCDSWRYIYAPKQQFIYQKKITVQASWYQHQFIDSSTPKK